LRKHKRLNKRNEGKKKMRLYGKVGTPQQAFIPALNVEA
jgi:translation elongation factor EF-4